MGNDKKGIPLLGYPATGPDEEIDRKEEETDTWISDVGEMWYNLEVSAILNAMKGKLQKKMARGFCKKHLRLTLEYAREVGAEKAESCISRLEKVYPIAKGKPLPLEIPQNIRKKYPK